MILTVIKGDNVQKLNVDSDANLLDILRRNNYMISAPCSGAGTCGKCMVQTAELGQVNACTTKISSDLSVFIEDEELSFPHLPICKNISIDIGTTTISVVCSDSLGNVLGVFSRLNAQRAFGGDVISRIKYASQEPDNLKLLTDTLLRQIGEIHSENIIITGNTVMQMIAAAMNPQPLGVSPYKCNELFGGNFSFGDYNAYFTPCISAFIGGDIVCGLIASDIEARNEPVIFIDLGTNGEMVLYDGKKYLACSTAAGPVFEGGNISCGQGGIDGAINKFFMHNGKLCYETISGTQPCGICGSGLLDLIACLLENNKIDENGHLIGEDKIFIENGIYLSQQDIIQFMLGKAAIASGLQILCDAAEIEFEGIGEIIITGGFGVNLNPESALKTGLIPNSFSGRITTIEDCAGKGALLLTRPENQIKASKIAEKVKYLELSDYSDFETYFTDNLQF